MRICYLTNLPAPYTVEFFNELGKLCDLTVLYERESASDRDLKWKSKAESYYTEVFLNGLKIGTENSLCPEVIKYLKEGFDAIVIGVYSTFTAMIAIMYLISNQKRFFISTDGGFVKEESYIKGKIKTYLMEHACGWFSPSKNTDIYLKYYGAQSEKIFRYPFTSLADSDILNEPVKQASKDQLREKLGLSKGVLAIGVGQFIPRKGWDLLTEAITNNKSLAAINFLIVGGDESVFATQIRGEIPENVKILPFLSKENLFEYYKAADFFILPTREDIWGLVLNEALSCGLPVITTNKCNAGLELIHDGTNGYLCKPESESIAKAIIKMCESDLISMSENALSSIGEYTYSKMAKRYYEEINSSQN